MSKWSCGDCGETHRENPDRCRSCRCTILTPVKEEPEKRNIDPVIKGENIQNDSLIDKVKGFINL